MLSVDGECCVCLTEIIDDREKIAKVVIRPGLAGSLAVMLMPMVEVFFNSFHQPGLSLPSCSFVPVSAEDFETSLHKLRAQSLCDCTYKQILLPCSHSLPIPPQLHSPILSLTLRPRSNPIP